MPATPNSIVWLQQRLRAIFQPPLLAIMAPASPTAGRRRLPPPPLHRRDRSRLPLRGGLGDLRPRDDDEDDDEEDDERRRLARRDPLQPLQLPADFNVPEPAVVIDEDDGRMEMEVDEDDDEPVTSSGVSGYDTAVSRQASSASPAPSAGLRSPSPSPSLSSASTPSLLSVPSSSASSRSSSSSSSSRSPSPVAARLRPRAPAVPAAARPPAVRPPLRPAAPVRAPIRAAARHLGRSLRAASLRADVRSMPSAGKLPACKRAVCQSDPAVGVTTSDVVLYGKIRRERERVEACVEERIVRCDAIDALSHYTVTAARAVTKMRHYAHSLQEAGVVLSDLILSANRRGAARLSHAELDELKKARELMKVARAGTLRWRAL
ncbi:hypothetical protein PRIPAC_76619, partial [Pristionchus pacificus]|uniref:Uncharacterized protein n=1 Tax=Pristionchus pacificus TaxID=54126 RepID=A0A2A6BER8_PRIPA|eukprot:PDM64372.1 hypothetical protein PRIPAC_52628 [Pristionchus pacificus]